MTKDTMKQALKQKTIDYWALACEHYDLPRNTTPQVKFDLTGRTVAGQAYIRQHYIRYNLDVAYHNIDDFYQTVGHEVAHIVQYMLYPHSQQHGLEWRQIMKFFGLDPKRCSRYDLTKVKSGRNLKRYEYVCGCPDTNHILTSIRHNRHQEMNSKMYYCVRCGEYLMYRREL